MHLSARFNRILVAAALASIPAFAWEETLTRDNGYWVQKVAGSEDAAPGGRLRLSTRGRVTVTGADDATAITYTFTKRVKARNEAEARKKFGSFVVKSQRQGDLTVIAVQHAGDSGIVDMLVSAPRSLRDVQIETFGGSVDASGLNGSIQTYTGGGRIKLDAIGGSVVAKTAGGEIVLGKIGGSVRCISAGGPIRADVIKGEARFETGGGEIRAREVEGPVYATTAGGGVDIERAGATVSAATAGGMIRVGSARGKVTAENQGGPIVVGAAAGVKCESGGGAITLHNVSGGMHASTQVGNILAKFGTGTVAESFLSTGAGDIIVYVPSNLAVTIQAQNESSYDVRRIVSDFPAVRVKREGSLVTAAGAINGGGPVIRLSSNGGMIYIRRE